MTARSGRWKFFAATRKMARIPGMERMTRSEAKSLQAPKANSEADQTYELSDELQERVDMLDLNETV